MTAAISNDPMVNFVHRRMPAMLLAGLALLVVYCSLVPFDFGPPQWAEPRQQSVMGLSVRAFNLPDIMVNIALYMPLGAGLFAVMRHGGRSRGAALIVGVFAPCALSLVMEETQAFERTRVAAWADVVANSLGTIMGVVFAAAAETPLRRIFEAEREKAARNWWLSFSKVLACFVVLVMLRPYDLATDPKVAVKNLLRHAEMSPVAKWDAIPAEVGKFGGSGEDFVQRAQWEYVLDRSVEAALFAALAATLIVGLCRDGVAGGAASLGACLTVHTLAASIMFIRVLLVSRGFDTSILPCATIGWLIGIVAGRTAIRRFGSRPGVFSWPRRMQSTAAIVVLGLVGLYGLAPFEFSLPANLQDIAWRVGLIPFKGVMASRFNDAFMAISGDLLKFAALGAVVAALSDVRRRLGVILSRAAVIAVTFASVVEAIHVFMPSRHCDVTHVVMALAGSMTGAAIFKWLAELRTSISRVEADDLLTGQLIAGETYQPIEVKTPPAERSDASPTDRAGSRPLP